jgi:hypothetical protein
MGAGVRRPHKTKSDNATINKSNGAFATSPRET